jgi:hypothetical protein
LASPGYTLTPFAKPPAGQSKPDSLGAPKIADMVTGKIETLNLTVPDSITLAPNGDLVMASQDDGELIYIHKTSASESQGGVLHLLHDVKVDDTAFIGAEKGFLLVADTAAEVIWKGARLHHRRGPNFVLAVQTATDDRCLDNARTGARIGRTRPATIGARRSRPPSAATSASSATR